MGKKDLNRELERIEKYTIDRETEKDRWIRIATLEREITVSSKFDNDSLKSIEATAERLFKKAKEKNERRDVT